MVEAGLFAIAADENLHSDTFFIPVAWLPDQLSNRSEDEITANLSITFDAAVQGRSVVLVTNVRQP